MLGHDGINTLIKHTVMRYYIRLHTTHTQTHTDSLSNQSG